MKLLLSPSKTQNISHQFATKLDQPVLLKKSNVLIQQIQSLSDEVLIQTLHIPKTQQTKVIDMYRNFGTISGSAIESYTGEAFKFLKADLTLQTLEKLQNRLYIFSGLYGILRPFDAISPYRLDLTMSLLENQSLTQFWKSDVNQLLRNTGEEILSLASAEFEKILEIPYTNVQFCKSDGTRVHTVLAKQMRGMMTKYIIEQDIVSIADVKKVELNGFTFKTQKGKTLIFQLQK